MGKKKTEEKEIDEALDRLIEGPWSIKREWVTMDFIKGTYKCYICDRIFVDGMEHAQHLRTHNEE